MIGVVVTRLEEQNVESSANWEDNLLMLARDAHRDDVLGDVFLDSRPKNFDLRQAYAQCGRITAQHSKSFYWASALLPREQRDATRALYAFCRTVDDLVDESDVPDRLERLEFWRRLSTGQARPGPGPVSQAWADTLRRFHIPPVYALQLIDGVASDLNRVRYESFEELSTYCYRVASTVGLMSMYITGFCCP